jgi:peptidase A4-like protein
MLRLLASILALSALAAVAATGGTASTSHRFFALNDDTASVSSNWSGYALEAPEGTDLQFTSITGTWKQPKATCGSGSEAASAFWVGLGGEIDTATSLEQTGTSADCSASGVASYYAWYELLPAAAVKVPLKVRPGDVITTSVNVNDTNVLIQIKNRTRKTVFTKSLTMDAPDLTSAEWVAEAPSSCDAAGVRCTVLPLANFGKVTFTKAASIASAHPGTITDPTWSRVSIKLVPGGSQFGRLDTSPAGALPGALTADGRGFPVTWISNAAA